mgnify:CR=1 FL=1
MINTYGLIERSIIGGPGIRALQVSPPPVSLRWCAELGNLVIVEVKPIN